MEDLIIIEYIAEGRKNEKRKTEDPSLSFKEMTLGIAINSVSVKVEKVDGSTDICWLNTWEMAITVDCYRSQKMSLVMLQGEREIKMMYGNLLPS